MTTIRLNPDGTLDEIVGAGKFHIEQLGDDMWFICVGDLRFSLWSKKRIQAVVQDYSDWKTAKEKVK